MSPPQKRSFAAEQLKRQKKGMSTGLQVFLVIVVILVVAGGYALFSRLASREEYAPEIRQKMTIAVLPFVDMSPEKDQESLCDGLSDTIINGLEHVEGLQVIARTSSFAFKGTNTSIREIGKQLNADTILDGSVLKSGNRVAVTAQLVKADDATHIFSERYHREMNEIFTIIEDISFAVVNKMKVTILENERAAILKRYTKNSKAYELYVKGRTYWNERDPESFRTALSYYNQAIEIDPEYALAYAGIADVYNLMGLHGGMDTDEAFPLAIKHARIALEKDNNLAEAYTSLAYATLYHDWDWNEAERLFKRAFEINPSYSLAHWWYKDYLLIMQRFDEAYEDILQALKRDPLSMGLHWAKVVILFCTSRCDELLEEGQIFSKIFPQQTRRINRIYGRYYLCKESYKQAIEYIQKSIDQTGLG